MDSPGVCKMISAIPVEGLEVGDMLEKVRIQFSILKCLIWGYIVCKLADFESDALVSKIVNKEVEESCVWLRSGPNSQYFR